MSYYIRSSQGVLIAEVTNRFAQKIINESKGHFRDYLAKDSDKTLTVFEFDCDYAYSSNIFRIFIWQGDLLIPNG